MPMTFEELLAENRLLRERIKEPPRCLDIFWEAVKIETSGHETICYLLMNLLMMLQVHQVMDCSKKTKFHFEMRLPKEVSFFCVLQQFMVKFSILEKKKIASA